MCASDHHPYRRHLPVVLHFSPCINANKLLFSDIKRSIYNVDLNEIQHRIKDRADLFSGKHVSLGEQNQYRLPLSWDQIIISVICNICSDWASQILFFSTNKFIQLLD